MIKHMIIPINKSQRIHRIPLSPSGVGGAARVLCASGAGTSWQPGGHGGQGNWWEPDPARWCQNHWLVVTNGTWLAYFFRYFRNVIIPSDSYFSEGWLNHQPDNYWKLRNNTWWWVISLWFILVDKISIANGIISMVCIGSITFGDVKKAIEHGPVEIYWVFPARKLWFWFSMIFHSYMFNYQRVSMKLHSLRMFSTV